MKPREPILALVEEYTKRQNIVHNPLTSQKLGAFVVLFDIEHKRQNQKTYTNFDYIKHSRYPWNDKINKTVETLKQEECLFVEQSTKGETIMLTEKGNSQKISEAVRLLAQTVIKQYGPFDTAGLYEVLRENTDFSKREKYTPVKITLHGH